MLKLTGTRINYNTSTFNLRRAPVGTCLGYHSSFIRHIVYNEEKLALLVILSSTFLSRSLGIA